MCKIYVVMDVLFNIPYYLLFFFITKTETFNFEVLEAVDIIILKHLFIHMPNSLKINAYYGEIRAMHD